MKRYLSAAMASSSLCAALSLSVQAAQLAVVTNIDVPAGSNVTSNGEALEEIVVNARRVDESIQDVPQSIDAIAGTSLADLDLLNFADLNNVVAGLTLDPTSDAITLRGVSFNAASQATPTVSTYVNDSAVQPAFMFNSNFDIGQFEVLRGPQGTYRGVSAPTGAINVETRRPDLQ